VTTIDTGWLMGVPVFIQLVNSKTSSKQVNIDCMNPLLSTESESTADLTMQKVVITSLSL